MKQLPDGFAFFLNLTAKVVPPNVLTRQNTNILATYLQIKSRHSKWDKWEHNSILDKTAKSPKEGLAKLEMKFILDRNEWKASQGFQKNPQ